MCGPAAVTCSGTMLYAGRSARLGCLPTMFQAIEIDGEPYWDGGYSAIPRSRPSSGSANRKIRSSCRSTRSSVKERPRAASEILNRLNEVSFNAVLAEGAAHDRLASASRRSRPQRRARSGPAMMALICSLILCLRVDPIRSSPPMSIGRWYGSTHDLRPSPA